MIEIVGVIGAGTMGNGIAQICAAAGVARGHDRHLRRGGAAGLATVGSSLERLVKKEKMTAADREAALGRITGTTDRSEARRPATS